MATDDYIKDLPSPERLKALMSTLIDLYRPRDTIIEEFRAAVDGRDSVEAPKSMQYAIKVSHGFHLAAILNEKSSRYRRVPEIKVIPTVGTKVQGEAQATELERALNIALESIDQNSDGNSWTHLVKDCHVVDFCVERIERAPAAWWPEISIFDDQKKNKLMYLYQDKDEYEKAKDDYLKQAGIPIRRVRVTPERFYPNFEGTTLVESLEFEERSLQSVLNNKLFDASQLRAFNTGRDGGVKQQVVIMHYSNHTYHAYYALGPSGSTRTTWPSYKTTDSLPKGNPILLYAYKHNLGRSIYNYMSGYGSGWRNGENQYESIMRALLELSRDQDQLRSQMLTVIRNRFWPTRVFKMSMDSRGASDGPPPNITIPESGTINIWKDEEIEDLTMPVQEFNLAEWMYNANRERMAELAGSAALSGGREGGVYTGYHQQLQISQAEHLDALIEASLARGAVQACYIMLEHIKAMGEKCYVHMVSRKPGGKQSKGKYVAIDPALLTPMPILSAKVRDPRPTDVLTGVQAALQATQIRPGHGTPLVTTDYALENFLGIEDPDNMDHKIRVEQKKNEMLNGPVVTQMLGIKLGLALAQREAGTATPAQMAGASPGMQAAVQQIATGGEAAQMGGVSPNNLIAIAEGGQAPVGPAPTGATTGGAGAGLGGGVPAGNPQPMQTAGRVQEILRQVTGG